MYFSFENLKLFTVSFCFHFRWKVLQFIFKLHSAKRCLCSTAISASITNEISIKTTFSCGTIPLCCILRKIASKIFSSTNPAQFISTFILKLSSKDYSIILKRLQTSLTKLHVCCDCQAYHDAGGLAIQHWRIMVNCTQLELLHCVCAITKCQASVRIKITCLVSRYLIHVRLFNYKVHITGKVLFFFLMKEHQNLGRVIAELQLISSLNPFSHPVMTSQPFLL